ncbi:MAG: cell wall-active antibiotics response protein, partial [Microbacteriaceae bacterium]|nr:cell wall-active antibiotics response protein [Microbacteriaceae bacterium]
PSSAPNYAAGYAPGTAASYAPGTPASDAATVPMAPAPAGAPPTDATELAAWTAQQARFKQERDEFVKSEEEARRAAFAAHAEEQRRIREERAAAYRAERRLTRSNPLYTLVAIGLALVVGALVTLVVGDYSFTSRGLVAGLASALAVLGTAIVVNGIRGKRSGGSSGFAVVVAIVLVGAGVVTEFSSVDVVTGGSRFTAIADDDTEFAPSHADGRSQDYVVGVGDAVIDLTGYWDGQTGSLPGRSSVDIVGGLGDITVILPDDEFVTVDSVVGWGDLSTPDRDFGRGSYDDLSLEFGPDGETAGATDRRLALDIIVGAGDLTITTEGDR